jgi:hypothetical protein
MDSAFLAWRDCRPADQRTLSRAREKELLPVPYYHVIFTLPHELRAFARLHQKELYGLLIKAAAHSIVKLAADPHYLGGLVGVMAVSRALSGDRRRSIVGWTGVDACQRRLSGSCQGFIEIVSRHLPRQSSQAI